MSLTLKRRVTVLATVISVMLVAGVVFAAFTANGEGNGTAESFALQNDSTVTAKTAAADLWPGASSDLTVTVTNGEDFPAKVTSISAGSSDEVGAGETLCDAGAVTTLAQTDEDLSGATIDPGMTEDFTIEATMLESVGNTCAGQDFNLDFDVVLTSVPE